MFLHKIPVGVLDVNCYIIGDDPTGKAAAIDPGGDADKIVSLLEANNLELSYIILTHGHGDHIGGVKELQEKTGAPLYIHRDDLSMIKDKRKNYSVDMGMSIELTTDHFVADGDKLSLGNLKLEIIHTPGHSRGGICIKVNQVLFTGDTLFSNSIGRTDLIGGNHEQLVQSIKEKLMILSDEITVFPGHGPATRIGIERLTNPYIK